MSLKEKLLDLFFPPRCAFCRRTGVHGVCADCERTLPYAKVQLCEGAGFGRCASPLLYEDAVRESLLRFKFHGAQSAAAEKAAAVQEKTSFLPDYGFADSDSAAGTSVSGLVGCALVAALAAIISLAGRAARKRSGKKQASAG